MLNPFPELLFLQAFAPLLIRLTIGIFFLSFSWSKIKKNHPKSTAHVFEFIGLKPGRTYDIALACIQIIVGVFLIVGFMTQLVAAVAVLILIISLITKVRYSIALPAHTSTYLLLFVMALTLIITGAGIPALDLPL